jgi:hypothetical protein
MSLRHPPNGVVAVFTPAPKEFNLHSEFDRSPSLNLIDNTSDRRKARQAPLGNPATKKKGDGTSRANHTRPTLSQ